MDYFGVKNLEKYQHYKDRDPKWVKLYYSILDDEAFIFLSEIDRCRYMTCLILASRNHNKIPADPAYLKKVMRLDKSPDIQPLLSCGLLYRYEPSSICLDKLYTNAPAPNGSLLSSPLVSSSSLSQSEEGKESEKGERNYQAEAKEVLAFLNEKSGKKYREVGVNLDLIISRLKSGVTAQQCKTLVMRKVRDWGTDEKMSRFLRPETLFNRTKFEAYLAEVTL